MNSAGTVVITVVRNAVGSGRTGQASHQSGGKSSAVPSSQPGACFRIGARRRPYDGKPLPNASGNFMTKRRPEASVISNMRGSSSSISCVPTIFQIARTASILTSR